MARFIMLAALVATAGAAGAGTEGRHRANPIRKVVTMLQNMQTKVTEEGKAEEKLYEDFMCYCKTGADTLAASIADGKAKIEALTAAKEGGSNALVELQASLKSHEESRAEAKEAVATATALREKEASVFAEFKATTETNLAALGKAVSALESGVGGSFLQTKGAASLKKFAMEKADMTDGARETILSFLSGTEDEEYAPQSGEIIGILKQMGDQMTASLKDATAVEEAAIKSYDSLMKAKTKEIETLQAQIEEEMMRLGEMGVGGASTANDLEDTEEQVEKDIAYLAELKKSCATKTAEWEEIQKTRAEELVALADTIKVLNDDDALELFKKTLPSASASFMQVMVSSESMKKKALAILRAVPRRSLKGRPELDLIALALHGKQAGFEKVIGMIDEMAANLKAEQADDDSKVKYCAEEFDKSEDKKKGLELSISDSETAIEELKGSIAAIEEEIEGLEDAIKALDKSVAEATDQRKAENADYKELMANDGMAKEVLGWAKNRLNKFYNPKLYKPEPKRELSAEDQLVTDFGGTLAPTNPPGGIAGTGIGFVQAHTQNVAAPPPPPAAPGPFKKKTEESAGVIGMIDLLIADLDKEMQESEVMEKDAQADYEAMMAESKDKRATDTESLTNKAAAKAEAEEGLSAETSTMEETKTDLMQTLEYIHGLHGECDWIMKFYDVRKEARTSEIDALGKAKAVLSGADFSLVQTGNRRSLLRR